MHFKRLSIFTLFFVIALMAGLLMPGSGWGGAQPAHGTTFTVTSSADSGAGTLRALVAAAVTGDTIQFASGITLITLTSGQINISQGITIGGPGSSVLSISGNNSSRIFNINSLSTVNINYVTLTNGNVGTGVGGAIYSTATVNLYADALNNNVAGYGGAVYNNATLNVYYSTFNANTANGGTNLGNGGALNNNDSTMYVYGCTFTNNTAGKNGGAITNFGNSTTAAVLTVSNSTISGNNGGLYGGGIYDLYGAFGYGSVSFSSNIASNGGDIYNTIDTSTGIANQNNSDTPSPVVHAPNNIPGGVVHGENSISRGSSARSTVVSTLDPSALGDAPLSGSSVTGNGGSIFNGDGTSFNISNYAIYSDHANTWGGGVYNGTGTFTINNFDLDGNSAIYGGGIINFGTLNVTNSTLYSNGGSATINGGGICNLGTVNLNSDTFAFNNAGMTGSSNGGGGVYNYGGHTVNALRTLFGGNLSASIGPDFANVVVSNGHNLVQNTAGSSGFGASGDLLNLNPLLGNPTYNSPFPQTLTLLAPYTVPLQPGSPAILAGGTSCLSTDERFVHRKSTCDIGAYESPYSPLESVGVYNSSGVYFLKNTNAAGAADFTFSYGAGNLIPIVGDWTGQGIKTIGLYDTSTSTFYLRNSNTAGGADITFSFGTGGAGFLPIVGDWTGAGHDGIGIYSPTSSYFYLKEALSAGTADYTFSYGPTGGGFTPLAGDWAGNGFATIGLYDNNQSRFYLHGCHATNCNFASDIVFQYGPAPALGGAQATPVMGRWVGQRNVTAGVYVGVNAFFYLKNTNAAGNADNQFQFGGTPGFRPIFGDWANVGIHAPGGPGSQTFTGSLGFVSNRGGQWGIYKLNGDEQHTQALTTIGANALESRPAWSADGQRVAFVATKDGGSALYVMNADGSGLKRLTWNKALNYQPSWSPDGKQIVFASNLGNSTNLYIMDVDSGNVRQLTHSLSEVNEQPTWSPDGSHIAYATGKGTLDLAVIAVDGKTSQVLTKNGRQASWSPDGKQIAFASTRDGSSQIYVMNADGSNIRRLTNNKAQDEAPVWSPNGKQIAFSSTRDGNSQIYVMNADGSNAQRLTNNKSQDTFPVWLR